MATTISLTDLTNGTLTSTNEWSGTGIFDKLIEAVNKNIEGQYNLGRIGGPDYANVYLGSMQSVIAESVQYILQEKQVEAQTDLLITQNNEAILDGTSKRAEIAAQTQLLIDQDSELLLNGTSKRSEITAQTNLLDSQRTKVDSDTIITKAQSTKDLLVKQAQIDLELSNKAKVDYETSTVLPKQVDVEERKIAISESQSTKDLLVKSEQIANITSEIDLRATQKSEVVLDGVSKRAVESAQELLVKRQTKGFDDDAYQKLLKQVLDSWSVGFSVSQTAVAVPDAIKVPSIDSVMNKAMSNLGI